MACYGGFAVQETDTSTNADLLWDTRTLGGWLRWLRGDRGFSIRRLAAISGVDDSEIHRIETGQSECRISSLIKLCAAVGASPGYVLDRAMSSNAGEFKRRILADPDFEALLSRLCVKDKDVAERIAMNLASACVLTAILLRSSDPLSRVKADLFPQPEWEKRFVAFASKIAAMDENVERANILDGLLAFPVRELSNQGLLAESILNAQAESYGKPRAEREDFGWAPWVLRYPKPLRID
jgi:transcriptional regulator with XRE-family HTH domain